VTLSKSKILKLSVLLLCAGGVIWTGNDLRNQYEHRKALNTQLAKIEAVQAEVAERNDEEQQRYQRELEQWTNVKARIESTNQQKMARWRANRTVVETIQVPVLAVAAPAPVAAPPETDDNLYTAPAAPPPAPVVEERYETVVVERPRPLPRIESVPPPPEPPKPTVLEISADGIKIELQEDTSWQTVLQLLVLLLVGYGGIRVINKYTETKPEAA